MNTTKLAPSLNSSSKTTNNDKYDSTFYILAGAGIAGLLGGMYLIYSALGDDDDLDDKELIEIEELKQDVETKGQITTDTAIHILYLTNHHAEEELKRIKPDIDKRRREALNDEVAYKEICSEYLEAKEKAYMASTNKIMAEFNTSMEALQEIVSKVDPQIMEKKYFEFDKPTFEEGKKPDAVVAKEAFLFYGNKFIEEMQGLSAQFRHLQSQMMNQQQAQEMAMFSLLTSKMKVEDLLQTKYNLSETQIRYLLVEYNLMTDRDVQIVNQKIMSFEEMMG